MKSDFSRVTTGKFLNSFVTEPPSIYKRIEKMLWTEIILKFCKDISNI